MDRGYVKLWRKSIDSRVWASDELWKLWTWCLIKASYRKRFVPIVIGKGVSSVEIMPGQFVWGRLSCAKEFGWNPSTTLKRMKKLESFGCLSLKSDTHYSVVSICNWASYQSEEDTEVTTRCQPSDNQVTTKGQPSDNQVTQTRRVKKLKKLKKESVCVPLKDGSFFSPDLEEYELWVKTYSCNVDEELGKLVVWNINNPKKRKTAKGVKRHICSWLDGAKSNTKGDRYAGIDFSKKH